MSPARALDTIHGPLERQIRALHVSIRAGAVDRACQHADYAVALLNEVTDLTLRGDDLLRALLAGVERRSSGQEVLDDLIETAVHQRLVDRGMATLENGEYRTKGDHALVRAEVEALLGGDRSLVDRDPRWRSLLAG